MLILVLMMEEDTGQGIPANRYMAPGFIRWLGVNCGIKMGRIEGVGNT
jgi:hypothetical protein